MLIKTYGWAEKVCFSLDNKKFINFFIIFCKQTKIKYIWNFEAEWKIEWHLYLYRKQFQPNTLSSDSNTPAFQTTTKKEYIYIYISGVHRVLSGLCAKRTPKFLHTSETNKSMSCKGESCNTDKMFFFNFNDKWCINTLWLF